MSLPASWFALSTDWDMSDMFDLHGDAPASTAVRLAWICLLADCKAHGRGGVIRLRDRMFGAAHCLPDKSVKEMLQRAAKAGAIKQDGDTVTVCNWAAYQHRTSAKNVRRAEKDTFAESAETTTTHHPSPITHHPPQKSRRFTPPSVSEVRAYCKERGNQVDPQAFVDFYASKGWRVGNQPMKDWQAAVRTWEKRDGPKKADTANERMYRLMSKHNIGTVEEYLARKKAGEFG